MSCRTYRQSAFRHWIQYDKSADETLELQIEIVKYIVSVKLAENVSLTWRIKYCGLVGFISGQFT